MEQRLHRARMLKWTEESSQRITISPDAAGGWLVLADAYASGWRATWRHVLRTSRTMAHEVVVAPAYGIVRAMPLPAPGDDSGRGSLPESAIKSRKLMLEYAPRWWRHAIMVSLAGLSLLLIMAGWSLLPHRHGGQSDGRADLA